MTALCAAVRRAHSAATAASATTAAPAANAPPRPPQAPTFNPLWAAAEDAIRAAHRASEFDYRANQRHRLWELPPNDPGALALGDRIAERKRATRAAAEEAEWRLDLAWDHASRVMPPVGASGPPVIDDVDLLLFAAATWQ